MTISVVSIMDRVGNVLQDDDHDYWTNDELIQWLNDAQREIVKNSPDANVITAVITPVKGTKQTLPDDAIRLVDVTRNMASDSITPLAAVRATEMKLLDSFDPNWHLTESITISSFMFDERNALNFYVYPAYPTAPVNKLEIVYNAVPAVVSLSGDITIPDIYAAAIVDYVLFRSFTKESEGTAQQLERASAHYRAFSAGLSAKEPVDSFLEPSRNR